MRGGVKNLDNILHVRTFGEFSVTWKGKRIAGGNGVGETQFVSLLQLLLHKQSRGVERKLLEEVLFAGRDIQDRGHAMRTVIYNAKKKAEKDVSAGAGIYPAEGRHLLLDG